MISAHISNICKKTEKMKVRYEVVRVMNYESGTTIMHDCNRYWRSNAKKILKPGKSEVTLLTYEIWYTISIKYN